MACIPRLNLPNISQHIVQCGNNRQVTFVAADDYVVYLEKLEVDCVVKLDCIEKNLRVIMKRLVLRSYLRKKNTH